MLRQRRSGARRSRSEDMKVIQFCCRGHVRSSGKEFLTITFRAHGLFSSADFGEAQRQSVRLRTTVVVAVQRGPIIERSILKQSLCFQCTQIYSLHRWQLVANSKQRLANLHTGSRNTFRLMPAGRRNLGDNHVPAPRAFRIGLEQQLGVSIHAYHFCFFGWL